MKYYNCIFLFIFFNGISVFSQEKYTRHTVSKGETISEIAKEYEVKSSEIYELNPDARNGIKFKTVLLIPSKAKKSVGPTSKITSNSPEISHEVLAKETLYGIAKQYNITIADLFKINSHLEKEGLKKGQIIKIPQTALDNLAINTKPEKTIEIQKTATPQKEATNKDVVVSSITERKIEVPTEGIIHEVLPKETLYAIAKQYKISLANLQKANATLGSQPLKAGQKINIPVKSDAHSDLALEERESKNKKYLSSDNYRDELPKQIPILPESVIENIALETEITHEVLPKETKYGIAKKYGLTIAELENQNPNIAKKLLVGSLLKLRSSKVIETKSLPVEPVEVKEEIDNKDFNTNTNRVYDAAFVDELVLKASENIGTRYRSGGTSTDGFDCSGLMYYTFSSYDIKLPRSSVEMASYGLKIDAQNAQKGDLIFFKTRGSGRINHVGMVVEVLVGEIKFIHSATHGGVIISSTKESYYQRNLAQVNRVL
jgi:cell wall-associated NlpC family hydrolase